MRRLCLLMTFLVAPNRTLAFTSFSLRGASSFLLSKRIQEYQGFRRTAIGSPCLFQASISTLPKNCRRNYNYNYQRYVSTNGRFNEATEGILGDMTGHPVVNVLKDSVSWLSDRNVPEPLSSATQLMAEALALPWENGFRQLRNIYDGSQMDERLAQQILNNKEWDSFRSMLERRSKNEPIQYILEKWDFMDFTLRIRAPLLCPRPETEELVAHVIADATGLHKGKKSQTLRILDVGCGTGAIGIALAKTLGPSVIESVTAIDIEPIAIETSNRNAIDILSSTQVGSYQAILSAAGDYRDDKRFDIVVSNPPYIPQFDMPTLSADVVEYESHDALCGGDDGMDVIRDIVSSLEQWCPDGGVCWMEVDPTHPTLLREWLSAGFGEDNGVEFIDTYKDLYGRERFVKLQYSPKS